MKRIFLIVGLILVILWLMGFVVFHFTTQYIHFLIVIGVILILYDIIGSLKRK